MAPWPYGQGAILTFGPHFFSLMSKSRQLGSVGHEKVPTCGVCGKVGKSKNPQPFFPPLPPLQWWVGGLGWPRGRCAASPPVPYILYVQTGAISTQPKNGWKRSFFWVGGTEVLAERANILCKVANPAGIFDDQKNAISIQG